MSDHNATIVDPNNLLGQVVGGRYAVERVLGDGSMGLVFLAEHTHMKKKVALKVMKPEFLENPEAVARFQREAQATGHIEHPHVCAATDFGQLDDDRFFLVMEYLDGRTLGNLLDREKRLEPSRVVKLTKQIASGLQRAHELEVVHRDLKPDNVILVEREGDPDFVKITDFGVARVEVVDAQNLTRAGTTMGTPVYMSPEQAVAKRADGRSDLYTLGVMMFEMLSGSVPFYSESLAIILSKHANELPPSLHDVAPDALIPADLVTIVERLLHKKPDERFQSAAELIEALDAADLSPFVPGLEAPVSSSESTEDPKPVEKVTVELSSSDVFTDDDSEPEPVVVPADLAAMPVLNEPKQGLVDRFMSAPPNARYALVFAAIIVLATPFVLGAVFASASSDEVEDESTLAEMAFSEDDVAPDLETERNDFLDDHDLDEEFSKLAPADAAAKLETIKADEDQVAHKEFLLAKSLVDDGKADAAMPHYEAALSADPRYATESRLVSDVRRVFSDKSDDVAAPAVAPMKILLGSENASGAVAATLEVGVNGSWNARKRARQVLQDSGQWDSLEGWQRDAVGLGLITKSQCEKGAKIVGSLAATKNPEVLPALKKASRRPTKGCGLFKSGDCYRCMREPLKKAIAEIEKAQAPE